jgi:hypothetical protein
MLTAITTPFSKGFETLIYAETQETGHYRRARDT